MYHIVGGRIDIKVHLHVRRLTTQKAKYLIWQITPILFSLLTFLLSRCYDNDYFVFFSRYDYSQLPFLSSFLYKRILRVIRNSRFFTDDPDKACLFVPSLDTLDRDRLSNEYIFDMGKRLAQLRHWNGGRNHLIFNLYSGTWPTYSHQLDFSYGNAILAKSSFSDSTYRTDYDVSIPLLHKNHKEKTGEKGMLRGAGNLHTLKKRQNNHYHSILRVRKLGGRKVLG